MSSPYRQDRSKGVDVTHISHAAHKAEPHKTAPQGPHHSQIPESFRGELKLGFTSSDTISKVSQQLEELINVHTSQGWEFLRLNL